MAFLFTVSRGSPSDICSFCCKGIAGKFGARGHPQTPTRLPAYPFPHYSNIPSRSAPGEGAVFGSQALFLHLLPGGALLSHRPPAPPLASPPPRRVSGPRHGGRRMADVRVSAASLAETVKGQEQCLGQPPRPQSPRPWPSHKAPLLLATTKPPTSWEVGRSRADACLTRELLPPPEGSSLLMATPDLLGCAPSPRTARKDSERPMALSGGSWGN